MDGNKTQTDSPYLRTRTQNWKACSEVVVQPRLYRFDTDPIVKTGITFFKQIIIVNVHIRETNLHFHPQVDEYTVLLQRGVESTRGFDRIIFVTLNYDFLPNCQWKI
jgi:hypothetical protein